jgi:tRNA threonylcarbamoyladenosine biosynthesis protein TsaE
MKNPHQHFVILAVVFALAISAASMPRRLFAHAAAFRTSSNSGRAAFGSGMVKTKTDVVATRYRYHHHHHHHHHQQWQPAASLTFSSTSCTQKSMVFFTNEEAADFSSNSSSSTTATTMRDSSGDGSPIVLYVPTADDMQDVGGVLASLILEKYDSDNDKDDNDNDATEEASAARPTLILMNGDLGAGKTCLTRGFVRTMTGSDDSMRVTSPTFLLSNTYPTSIVLQTEKNKHQTRQSMIEIRHLDLYRLSGTSPRDFEALDLDHVFTKCVALMEWPERLGNHVALPTERLEIRITIPADTTEKESSSSSSMDRVTTSYTISTTSNDDDDDLFDGEEDTKLRQVVLHPIGDVWKNRLQRLIHEGYVDDLLEHHADDEEDDDDEEGKTQQHTHTQKSQLV